MQTIDIENKFLYSIKENERDLNHTGVSTPTQPNTPQVSKREKKKKKLLLAKHFKSINEPSFQEKGGSRPISPIDLQIKKEYEELDNLEKNDLQFIDKQIVQSDKKPLEIKSDIVSKAKILNIGGMESVKNQKQVHQYSKDSLDELKDYLNDIQQKNIFKSDLSINFGVDMDQVGPRYNKNGEVISYSIVGSANLFNKKKIGGEKTILKLPKIADIRRQTSTPNNKSNSQFNSFNQEQLKTQQDVLREMEDIRNRIIKNQQKEQQYLGSLPFLQKQELTRQERMIKNYDKNENIWKHFVEQSTDKLNKDVSLSLLLQNENQRIKKEATDIFEFSRSDFETYGAKIWYMNLRRSDDLSQQKYPFLIMEEGINPLRYKATEIPRKPCEIIRKPTITDLNCKLFKGHNTSQSVSQISNHFFQNEDVKNYYNKRLKDVQKDIKEMIGMPIDVYDIEYDQLAVEGKSQFDSEYQAILKQQKQQIYVQKNDAYQELKQSATQSSLKQKSVIGYQNQRSLRQQFFTLSSERNNSIADQKFMNSQNENFKEKQQPDEILAQSYVGAKKYNHSFSMLFSPQQSLVKKVNF